MGIAGAAWATVIAQSLSAVLVFLTLMQSGGSYRIVWRRLAVDWKILKKIISVGLPAALQMVITSVSNIFVQFYINVFGSDVMFVTSRVFGTIGWVAFGYPAGWILCTVLISIYYKMGRWKKHVIQMREE